MELLIFVLVSAGILAIPGPNVLVVASTSAEHGRLRGFQTVAGTVTGMVIQLVVAALAATWLLSLLKDELVWIKWLAVGYVAYLVISHFRKHRSQTYTPISAMGSFQRGFWISLANPKTIIFFSIFLPQFVVSAEPYMPQIVGLSAIIWALVVFRDCAYVLLAHKLFKWLKARQPEPDEGEDSGHECGTDTPLPREKNPY